MLVKMSRNGGISIRWVCVGGRECVHGTVSLEDSLALLGNLVTGVPYIPSLI